MKRSGWLVVPAACVLLACNTTETEETPTEQTNQEKICSDSTLAVGSVPATEASFEVDRSIEPDESPYSYLCTTLAMHYKLADGTEVDLSGLDQISLFIQTDYQPGAGKATQRVVQLNAKQTRLSDGLIPGLSFGFPHPLFAVGTLAVGDVDSECRASDTCAQVDFGGFSPENDDYLLASVGADATVQVTSAGHEKGTRFAFSAASLPLVAPDRNGIQAVCDDGKIHYAR